MKNILIKTSVDGYQTGQVVLVENNVAHKLIDGGFAALAGVNEYNDKMIGSETGKKVIKTK